MFMGLMVTCISSLVTYVFKSLAQLFKNWSLCFLIHDFWEFAVYSGYKSFVSYANWNFQKFLIEVQLIHNVVLVSGVKWFSYTYIDICFFIFLSIMVYYKILKIVPCALQVGQYCLSLLYIAVCICWSQIADSSLSPPSPLVTRNLLSVYESVSVL